MRITGFVLNNRPSPLTKAAGDYMCVHVAGKTHIMRKTMKELEQELDPVLLQRVHHSAIVNVKQVEDRYQSADLTHSAHKKRSHSAPFPFIA